MMVNSGCFASIQACVQRLRNIFNISPIGENPMFSRGLSDLVFSPKILHGRLALLPTNSLIHHSITPQLHHSALPALRKPLGRLYGRLRQATEGVLGDERTLKRGRTSG